MTRSAGPARLASAGEEVGLVEQPAVQVGRHHERGRADAGERSHALGDLHERHRVDEGVGPDAASRHHGRLRIVASRVGPGSEEEPSHPVGPGRRADRERAAHGRVRRRAGASARRAPTNRGHRLQQFAATRVLEPRAAERRGAALGAGQDGVRHPSACRAVEAQRLADEGPRGGEAGEEVVPRRRQPGAEPRQPPRGPGHGRRIAPGRRVAEEPRRETRRADESRPEHVALGRPEDREERLPRAFGDHCGARRPHPMGQVLRGEPVNLRARLPDRRRSRAIPRGQALTAVRQCARPGKPECLDSEGLTPGGTPHPAA